MAPAESFQAEVGGGTYDDNWNEVLKKVRDWLSYLEREIDEPDLWDYPPLETGSLWDPAAFIDENTQFSADEITYLTKSIGEIKEYIQQQQVQNLIKKKFAQWKEEKGVKFFD